MEYKSWDKVQKFRLFNKSLYYISMVKQLLRILSTLPIHYYNKNHIIKGNEYSYFRGTYNGAFLNK